MMTKAHIFFVDWIYQLFALRCRLQNKRRQLVHWERLCLGGPQCLRDNCFRRMKNLSLWPSREEGDSVQVIFCHGCVSSVSRRVTLAVPASIPNKKSLLKRQVWCIRLPQILLENLSLQVHARFICICSYERLKQQQKCQNQIIGASFYLRFLILNLVIGPNQSLKISNIKSDNCAQFLS